MLIKVLTKIEEDACACSSVGVAVVGGMVPRLRPRYLHCLNCCRNRCCWSKHRDLVERQHTRLLRAGAALLVLSEGEPRSSSLSGWQLSEDHRLHALLLPLHPAVLNTTLQSNSKFVTIKKHLLIWIFNF